jgi:hypothetical protein
MVLEIVNTLQDCTAVKEVYTHQLAYSQIKCAVIDGVNSKEVQHILCARGRSSVNRAMAFCNDAWHERTSEM